MKKNYSEPTVTKINLDTEINLVLMSDIPPTDPTGMMMNNSEQTDGGMFSQFINPMKWFK
jgi:hypothetical protein